MTDDSDHFDWTDKENVIVPTQRAVAVYANSDGDLVIRRESDPMFEREDVFIVIGRRYARRVIEAMERVLKETAAPPSGE